VRLEGDGLDEAIATDRVGYTAFPMPGTLNDQVRETGPTPPQGSRSIRSDPTPPNGTRMSAVNEMQAERRRAARAAQAPMIGAPPPVLEERRRAAIPVFMVLGLAALAALLWTAYQVFAAG
jgi:hypothetical protein